MQLDTNLLFLLYPLIFLAGFIDAIAGGGGLISLPSYFLLGLPPHVAYGSNKFSSCMGTTFSVFRFIRSKRVHMKSAIASVCSALVGSALGVRIVMMLDEKYLRYCLIVLLPVIAVFVLTQRGFGDGITKNLNDRKIVQLSLLIGFVLGLYDGFFGPGSGSFMILAYTGLLGFDLTTSSGNAKIVNLAANVGALFTYILNDKVLFSVALPAAAFGILGNWIGSGLAIKNGSKIIKPVFVGVLVLLFLKISYDLFTGVN